MHNNFKISLEHVLQYEGGWSNNPQDPGGATMKGVTLAVFRKFYGSDKSKDDLKNITETQLECIYKKGYWDVCKCDNLPSGIDFVVFDAAVNSGTGTSVKWLQKAVEADVDGILGIKTLEQVRTSLINETIYTMCFYRLDFMQNLSNWKTFGKGWSKRVFKVLYAALTMSKE